MEIKTTQTILPDHCSLKEHIQRANLQACKPVLFTIVHNTTIVDPCRSVWSRDETVGLKPF